MQIFSMAGRKEVRKILGSNTFYREFFTFGKGKPKGKR